MSRRHLEFDCDGSTCVGTLDYASGTSGLLIVSGGNEVRSGAFDGQSNLAKRFVDAGYPVFRFDRRGIGDSEGSNAGYAASASDIAAAAAAFRKSAPEMRRIVAFGNCDAATALALHSATEFDALVLANPWIEDSGGALSGGEARRHYSARLRSPGAFIRLLKGKVSLQGLLSGLRQASTRDEAPAQFQQLASAINGHREKVTLLISGEDRTGKTFMALWGDRSNFEVCQGASHAFAEKEAQDWLFARLHKVLSQEQAG